MHFVAAIVDADRVFDGNFETGKVRRGEKTVVLRVISGGSLRDRSAIKEIVRGAQLFVAIAACGALGFYHAGDAAAEILLTK
jgi:hypothetical protein